MMRKTILFAVLCLSLGISAAATLRAQSGELGAAATIVMRSGDRINAEVIDIAAPGLLIRENGQERNINFGDVAIIDFAGGGGVLRAGVAAGAAPHLVLRNGQVVDGRMFDIGGRMPKILYVNTSSGQREFNSNEVAQVVLAVPNNVASVNRPANQPVGTVGRPGANTFAVAANREWTDTGVMVREGETVMIRANGQIELAPNQRVGAGGVAGGRRGDQTPLPAAPAGALIGRIDNGAPFVVGNQQSVRMPASGRLFLGVNDDVVSDNSGEFQVTVATRRR
jgi:PA-IL-like protein